MRWAAAYRPPSRARSAAAGARKPTALVLHAVVINIVLGLFFSLIFLLFGEPIYRMMGGRGEELQAALAYSNVVFAANIFIWLMNGLASVIRGTGNMWFPAAVTSIGVLFLVPVSPLLIFGFGPIPALGVAGGGVAVALFNIVGTAAMAWYILSGRNPVRFRWVTLQVDAACGHPARRRHLVAQFGPDQRHHRRRHRACGIGCDRRRGRRLWHRRAA